MKKIFFALMAVAAIAMTGTFTGCEKDPNNPEQKEYKGEPIPEENVPPMAHSK